MFGINPDKWANFKTWLVVQKYTLARGYSWLNVFAIGFISASQLKLLFPEFFDGLGMFIFLIFIATFILWLVGYIDKKMKLLHVENAYGTETNPILMQLVDKEKPINK